MIYCNITYDLPRDTYELDTNISDGVAAMVISDFLRAQIGQGKDTSPAQNRKIYQINIQLDLDGDVFTCEHDCGNKGLRDGILYNYLSKIEGS